MRSGPTPSDHEVLTALAERVTYQNAENGFLHRPVKARAHRELGQFGWAMPSDFPQGSRGVSVHLNY